MSSLYWFDYETFGTSALWDRPCQFGGVRTDMELNVIGEPMTIYCKQSTDYLPHPAACRVTGITPQTANKQGLPETEFIQRIVSEIGHPGTCSAGYNSIRFDDEFTRFTLFRNLQDPYTHEWKDGNSRWDLIDVVRLTRALRPDGINWPCNDDGSPSNRLEHLSQSNGIEHGQAHDAMADVWATIGMARLIRKKQPRLFDYVFANRGKAGVSAMLNTTERKTCLQVSGMIPGIQHNLSAIVPLCPHPTDKNGVIVLDLRQDPRYLLDLDSEEIARRLYQPADERDLNDESRPGLRTVRINRCPVVVPLSTLLPEDAERLEIDRQQIDQHRQWAEQLLDDQMLARIKEVMTQTWQDDAERDVDGTLYSGSFLSSSDRTRLQSILKLPKEQLASELEQHTAPLDDKRLPEMVWRYLARNYPEVLTSEQKLRWATHCLSRFANNDAGWLGMKEFLQEIDETDWPADQESLKQALRDYADQLASLAQFASTNP